jgi:hypothetical protein
MNSLIAIVGPTPGRGHGECFIWTRGWDSKVVAIDAGGAASTGKHAGAHNPDILILTHDDSDHIRGAVELIKTARASLQELWIPAEWAILIKQIAETNQVALFPDDAITVNMVSLVGSIAGQLSDQSGQYQLSFELLSLAEQNLRSWDGNLLTTNPSFSIDESSSQGGDWYGAQNVREIIERVKRRAIPLIDILTAALTNSIRIRFFSIDLALSRNGRIWETEGRAGTVTLANASEAPHALAVQIPPGLPHSYALTRLTVQNRRALCTLLWNDTRTPNGGAVIWSDTDGNWLDHMSPRGFNQVVGSLCASSAPHHGSANSAHNRVWAELRRAPSTIIMISAGGYKRQSYRPEYNALSIRRCCTWCRPTSTTYQDVTASSNTTGSFNLHDVCAVQH